MRRILTTLMILLVVLIAGLSSLVLLVNPNDFRSYMVKQVESRTGYQLQLDGSLRWHVWPRLSILSGRMTLTAPGASAPLVRADNMRLDVSLLPLLSHQLQVKQVMLKGAVVQLTPQTEASRSDNAPVAPKGTSLPQEPGDRGWRCVQLLAPSRRCPHAVQGRIRERKVLSRSCTGTGVYEHA